jgi:hypothetical protein
VAVFYLIVMLIPIELMNSTLSDNYNALYMYLSFLSVMVYFNCYWLKQGIEFNENKGMIANIIYLL